MQHIVTEVSSQLGDLFVLDGGLNSAFAHGAPRDPAVQDLRVSLTFRRVLRSRVHPARRYFVGPTGKREVLPAPRVEVPAPP
eukprot:8865279-Alexandrium_andersonii.AAC.1